MGSCSSPRSYHFGHHDWTLPLSPPLEPGMRSIKQPWEWRKGVKDTISTATRNAMQSEHDRDTQNKVRRSAVSQRKALDFQVNTALRKRMEETRVSKDRLKLQLARVDGEIKELEASKHKLEQTLQEKQHQLRVSGHCMRRRTQRPERERVRDEVEELLEHEYSSLSKVVQSLERELAQVQTNLRHLNKSKQQLDADVRDKRAALQLDADCLRLRYGLTETNNMNTQ